MHCNRPLFSPEPSSAGDYVMVVLNLLNNFHKSLKERQSLCLNKVRWGQPVLPGKHASFTIDRKHRGTPNPYDTDPNAAQTDDETEIGETQPAETTACTSENLNAVVLDENDPREKSSAVSNKMDVAIITDKPLIPPLSHLESVTHSNEDGNIKKWKNKKLKLSNKLSNKENHKKHGKLRCLQRRSLFRKSRMEASSATPSIPEIQTVPVSDTSPKEMTTILPDSNTGVKCSENIIIPCDDLPSAAVCLVSEESSFNNKLSPPPKTPYLENENSSPLRESNLPSPCEIRSSSPIFSAYESPFRNSNIVSRLKDYSMAKVESSVSADSSVTNEEKTNVELLLSSSSSSKPQPRLPESDYQDVITNDKIKRKTRIGKKIQKQKAMVQCPLCCDWFKRKVIEVHAANCGITAAATGQHDAMAPELKTSSDAGLTDAVQDPESTCQTEPSSVVLELVKESVMPLENETTCTLVGNQVENSDFVPVQKHCFLCDLSYVDGKPFSYHLRMCRKKYQKLKRQFPGFSEESEEPKRKTRHSSLQREATL